MSGRPEVSRPLAGTTVLITRARQDAAPLHAALEALGAAVVELPVVAYEPPDDPAPLQRALQQLDQYDWIAFASRNAVRACLPSPPTPLPRVGEGSQEGSMWLMDTRIPVGTPPLPWNGRGGQGGEGGPLIAAVGPATAADLAALGIAVDCVPERATGAALAEAMTALGVRGKRVLLPQGDRSRPELRDGLERAGAVVEEVIAYRTVAPDEVDAEALGMLRRGRIGVVALASPSAVHNLVGLLGPDLGCLASARLACIGPTTASAVREVLGREPDAVAEQHTVDGLVEAILRMEKMHDNK